MNIDSKKISNILLEQRVRNNIIEHFELASSEELLVKYQTDVPIAIVPNELINGWYDAFYIELFNAKASYTSPVYTQKERDTLLNYNEMMNNICLQMPNNVYDINDVFQMTFWPTLKNKSQNALSIFMERGLFSDDIEMKKIKTRLYS